MSDLSGCLDLVEMRGKLPDSEADHQGLPLDGARRQILQGLGFEVLTTLR